MNVIHQEQPGNKIGVGQAQQGVRRILGRLQGEIERDMKLMGITRLDQLNRSRLRLR